MTEGNVIFIVDDDPIHRLLMDKLFARQPKPCKLYFFENGQKALEALKEPSALPDLILLDIEMPVMNGWQFMDAFSQLDPALIDPIPVYMVSSSFSDVDQDRVKRYPRIRGYIVKPIRIEKIIELLE
ncbi:response regulator [Niabella drilacis]|uniref:Response regulator receiver domain-containing protein n=1 Tax=Niabella drilacis (strain DSM 25811 / CCM 8410 / CCUG 62505 / LMG 26954 / E90) TaxID=1285928 RepID=A0A1G6SGM1_NIADE|nr:response regulator [Niabella drilacis]SDD16062.1 Response regulator receiver domain-containing protein [Niabella drilacis]